MGLGIRNLFINQVYWYQLRLDQDLNRFKTKPAWKEMNAMWAKWLSLRRWGHVFRRILPCCGHPGFPCTKSSLFAVPAIIYWVMPDVLPWVPIDDMAVTLLLMNWFTARAERKYRV
ncbi:hypothetical protein LJK87_03820 [Paenibacillus sp. P25]|nr:hypothetical protein LJK87_03820 [Paenibacillus sp. P25]